MNGVDILLCIVMLLTVLGGIRRGFLFSFFDLVAWIGALLLTFWLYPYAAKSLEKFMDPESLWLLPLAFFLSFLVLRLLTAGFVAWLLGALPGNVHQHAANKAAGAIPGILNGLIYTALLATFLVLVPLWPGLARSARNSVLAQQLSTPLARIEDALVPALDETLRRSLGGMNVAPESEKSVKLSFTVKETEPRPELEQKMLTLINEERSKEGLPSLEADTALRSLARAYGKEMFRRGYFSHYTPEGKGPFDRMNEAGIHFLTAGENLSLARTLMMAHIGLMHSTGHRANILQPSFGRVGIGVIDGGIYGLMICQEFRN